MLFLLNREKLKNKNMAYGWYRKGKFIPVKTRKDISKCCNHHHFDDYCGYAYPYFVGGYGPGTLGPYFLPQSRYYYIPPPF